jgi:hypothetical protein
MEPTTGYASPTAVIAISARVNSMMFLVAGLLAACSPAHSTGPVASPPLVRTPRTGSPAHSTGSVDCLPPAGSPQPGDIVLTDAVGQPVGDRARTVIVKVGQTIAVVLTTAYDTGRGVFVSAWTPGASSLLPSSPGYGVSTPPLKALGGNRFQAVAVGLASLVAQAHSSDAAQLVWQATVVVQQ